MSFAALSDPAVDPVVERFAGAGAVTLLVGAGASMESFLPSWPELIERLLWRVAEAEPRLATDAEQEEWIRRTIDRDDLLGAGAVVEVMSRERLTHTLPRALYEEQGAGAFEPGPISDQVAYLRGCFGDRLTLLTTNYDDLIERALANRGVPKSRIRPYVRRRTPPAGAVAVTHLHGYAGRGKPPSRLVLTEEHYHSMQRGSSWQEQLVTSRLEESLCLFVGTSLTDPNLIRYLYGYQQSRARRHAAIFVRQGETAGLTPSVRWFREEAVRRRWGRCGVDAVFVDHFADAAQLLHEIGYRREDGSAYVPVPQRAARWIEAVETRVLRIDDADAFAERQVVLSRILRGLLERSLSAALERRALPAGERLAISVWLLSRDGRALTGWAHSDRAHQDPSTIAAVPVTGDSSWVAVRAVCQGVQFERDHDNYASRWHFVRGRPLVLETPSRIPVGCITIASTRPQADSVLEKMAPERRAGLHCALESTVKSMLTLFMYSPSPGARPS